MELGGLHHLTAVTTDAKQNVDFYTRVLGMRLVKKTVNQDDVSAYHLFYADALGSPGTDVTFFDWPHLKISPNRPGAGEVSITGLRVPDRAALNWCAGRVAGLGGAPARGPWAAWSPARACASPTARRSTGGPGGWRSSASSTTGCGKTAAGST